VARAIANAAILKAWPHAFDRLAKERSQRRRQLAALMTRKWTKSKKLVGEAGVLRRPSRRRCGRG